MLVEFSVRNYLSFRDRVTFSMVASPDTSLLENTFEVGDGHKLRLLKTASVYGANASGKSNLLKAIEKMAWLVRFSAPVGQRGDPTGIVPFLLDPATEAEPSEFEVVFIAAAQRYVYGFVADKERVHEEWLTATHAGRKTRTLFERHQGDVKFGASWAGGRLARAELQETTRDNALLLSRAAQLNAPAAMPAFDWFWRRFAFIEAARRVGTAISKGMVDPASPLRGQVIELLQLADLRIDGIETREASTPSQAPAPPGGVPGEAWEALQPFLELERQHIGLQHRRSDGATVTFDLEDESQGTQRLFALSGPWLVTLHGALVLLIDEFESKLHPLIARHLVRLAHRSATNAQVIFTTHDCGLLDSGLFRRDQVWFTERDPAGATDLYSLWDYKPRRDENLRNGYLHGRYGAIPFVGDLSIGEES